MADREYGEFIECPSCGCTEDHDKLDKIDHLHGVALKVEKLVDELGPQIAPILAGLSKNPMLKMLGL